jgi:hypothetical protein
LTDLLDAALSYGARGWPVLPLHTWADERCTCGQRECSSPAKHPRLQHGLHEASTDEDTIVAWWRRWPTANVGLRTGVAFDVLDVDGQEGRASIIEACTEHGPLPDGPWSLTGGGGDHLLFRTTGAGNRAGILPKVDWRGRNGYVVAPPSLHASGDTYAWEAGPETPLSAAPEWLVALVAPTPRPERPSQAPRFLPPGSHDGTPYGLRALEAEISELARAAVGLRNHSLNGCAFNLYQLVAGGELQEGVVTDRLRSTAIGIGLGELEVEKTLASARSAGIAVPRSAPKLRMVAGGDVAYEPPPPEPDYDIDYEPSPDDGEADEPSPVEVFESKMLTLDAMELLPPPEYVIDKLLAKNSVAAIYGAPGGGKSFLALDLGAHIATGSWWQGREVEKGQVLFVAAEGSGGWPKRAAAWKKFNRTHTVPDFHIYPGTVNLLNPGQVGVLVEVCRKWKFALVVIDTVARSMVGGDENTAKDMGMVVDAADWVKTACGGCVLLIHHSGKDTAAGLRGSSALLGATDTVMEVKAGEDGMELVCRKQKDDAEFMPFRLALEVVEVTVGGQPETSCAVAGRSRTTRIPETRADQARGILVHLMSSTGMRSSEIRNVLEERMEIGRTAAYEVINMLVSSGVLVNTGSERQPFYVLQGGDAE